MPVNLAPRYSNALSNLLPKVPVEDVWLDMAEEVAVYKSGTMQVPRQVLETCMYQEAHLQRSLRVGAHCKLLHGCHLETMILLC